MRDFVNVEAAYAKGKQTDTLLINLKAIEVLTKLRAMARPEWVFVSRTGQSFKSIRTVFTCVCQDESWPKLRL